MSTLSFSDISSILYENYGAKISEGITQEGPGNWMVPDQSFIGCLRAKGRVFIGGADGNDRHPREWGIHSSTATATSIDGDDNFPAATQEGYGEASLAWTRYAVTMEFDNLVRLATRKNAARGQMSPITEDFKRKLKALVHDIEQGLATDGTGNSSKDITGFLSFLSASNTYAGLAQTGNTYWQAVVEAAGSAVLTRTHLRTMLGTLWDRGVLDDTSELWMPRQQWNRYVDLFADSIRFDNQGGSMEKAVPMYDDGVISAPIKVLPGVPSTEIWCVNLGETELRFLDHTPEDELNTIKDEEVMHEGIPVGFEQIETGKDKKAIALKAYVQLVNCTPRANGIITGLTA